ncbi:MAG: aroE [Caulobacteraceae bacterium]|nr:aroE [Caulobacteraceae bacterium]
MSRSITGATMVAGVVGHPVRHSVSPILHNAWLEAAGIDGVYVAFATPKVGFARFVEGLRGGAVRGLNVTIPFKEEALALADRASERARMAGAANLLVFEDDGTIVADNTDGLGLLGAFAEQAPAFAVADATVAMLGAGGAARGAAAALILAGAAEVRLVNRTVERARGVAAELGGQVRAFGWDERDEALAGAQALINATSLGLEGGEPLEIDLAALPKGAPVMDMVYRPLRTPLLEQAKAAGRPTVDGLAMLIGQAVPSFEALFGARPPAIDVRGLAIAALGL